VKPNCFWFPSRFPFSFGQNKTLQGEELPPSHASSFNNMCTALIGCWPGFPYRLLYEPFIQWHSRNTSRMFGFEHFRHNLQYPETKTYEGLLSNSASLFQLLLFFGRLPLNPVRSNHCCINLEIRKAIFFYLTDFPKKVWSKYVKIKELLPQCPTPFCFAISVFSVAHPSLY